MRELSSLASTVVWNTCGLWSSGQPRSWSGAKYRPPFHRDAVQRLGFPLCPACNRCPRRTDSKFCGSLCEMWTVKRDLEMEVREELLQLGQQQEHQQRYQERQNWQSPTMGPPEMVPNVNAVASSNATRGAVSYPHRSSWRYQQ